MGEVSNDTTYGREGCTTYYEFESSAQYPTGLRGHLGRRKRLRPGWLAQHHSCLRTTRYCMQAQPAIDISTAIDHNDTSDDHLPCFDSWTASHSFASLSLSLHD